MALNFYVKRKPFIQSLEFYARKTSQTHVHNLCKIYVSVEIYLKVATIDRLHVFDGNENLSKTQVVMSPVHVFYTSIRHTERRKFVLSPSLIIIYRGLTATKPWQMHK